MTWVMRITHVPFGNNGSVSVKCRYHLSQYQTSHVVEELTSNMSVDNWISGCDDHVHVT